MLCLVGPSRGGAIATKSYLVALAKHRPHLRSGPYDNSDGGEMMRAYDFADVVFEDMCKKAVMELYDSNAGVVSKAQTQMPKQDLIRAVVGNLREIRFGAGRAKRDKAMESLNESGTEDL